MNQLRPTEDILHAYVDGHLDAEARQELEAVLARSPELAAQLAGWKRDAERLRVKCANEPLLSPNPRLDPAVLRRGLRARAGRRLAVAAMLVIAVGLGGTAGWQARDWSLAAAHLPMADAVQAYRVFATAPSNAVEVSVAQPSALQAWLSGQLGRATAVPDLGTYGFRLLGGRLLATEQGPAAIVPYEDAHGQRIAFYMRPGPPFETNAVDSRRDGGLLAQYWYRNGYRFAVISRADDTRSGEVLRTLHGMT
ncbi:MAG TPA: hypothetical protein VE684_03230 [Crenalkalicoccus sp.]|jgi:anti-sigma factor RsiW|nr:hypothetical protein [Crenalkalicoccus sp.]